MGQRTSNCDSDSLQQIWDLVITIIKKKPRWEAVTPKNRETKYMHTETKIY